jgi:hypothetical protein
MRKLALLVTVPFFYIVGCNDSSGLEGEKETEVVEETIEEQDAEPLVTTVEDCRDNPCADFDLTAMSTGDVSVRRETGEWGEGYRCFYFHDVSDSLNQYAGILVTEDDYDQATYEWIDDTTITFILQNTVTNTEHELQLFGNGSVNGMIVPDREKDASENIE